MTKKFLLAALCSAVALAACSPSADSNQAVSAAMQGKTVSIETARGTLTLPENPLKPAVFDLAALDTLEVLNVQVAGAPKKVLLPYLKPVIENANGIGTLFEPDYEALNALKPGVIIISGRTAPKFDELSKIAITADMSDSGDDLIGDGLKRLDAYGVLFGKKDEAARIRSEIEKLSADTAAAVKGKGNGLILMVNGGKLSAFGPTSRFGWIHKDLGIPAADGNISTAKHGQPVSFEYIQKTDPDWIFVLDRSAAIGEEGQAARVVLDNELVRNGKAWKAGHVIYLSPAAYLAAGGVQQIRTDLNNIKTAFSH